MLRLNSKSILTLFLSFCFVSSSIASPGFRTIASVQPVVSATLEPADLLARESQVISEIDRQADVVFREFQKTHSQIPFSILKHAQRQAVYRLKQMHAITDILKASGPATATTLLATEVLTNFVLAPIATAFGKPEVGGVLLAVPWGLIAGFSVFSFQTFKLRYQLARDLGLKSLKPLDRIRDLVVGYDLKFRVSSIIYQSMNGDIGAAEFEVLRKGMDFSLAKVPAVTIDELETLVREHPEGAGYLRQIYVEQLDPAFYSALLLRFINSDLGSIEKLMDLVAFRLPSGNAQALGSSDLRKHLIAISDVRSLLDREIQISQTKTAGLKKLVKNGELTKAEMQVLKKFLAGEMSRLRELRRALSKHEYAALQDASGDLARGQSLADVAIESSRSTALVEIAAQARFNSAPINAPALALVPAPLTPPVVAAIAPTCSDVFAVGF